MRTVQLALRDVWIEWGCPSDAVLVHGACHLGGADKIAADCWASHGFPTEAHPAKRDPNSGRLLGPERNKRMVDLGADLCLAFPHADSRGTRNCLRLAREAGIEVRVCHPKMPGEWVNACHETWPGTDGGGKA